jgi:PAS domain-containing protein
MKWYETVLSRRYALWGIVGGLIFPIVATFVEIVTHAMPFASSSIWSVQRNQPLLWIIDTLPLILGFIAANPGAQRGLASVVQRGKKDWKAIFDSFSEPILVTDANGLMIRCNHAVIDRLNAEPIAQVALALENAARHEDLAGAAALVT